MNKKFKSRQVSTMPKVSKYIVREPTEGLKVVKEVNYPKQYFNPSKAFYRAAASIMIMKSFDMYGGSKYE